MADILEFAEYLICLDREKARVEGEDAVSDMTPLKLQKLLYYCQGYSLGLYEKSLFEEAIHAWPHGPVFISVYNKYKAFGGTPIPFESVVEPVMDERAQKIAEMVMRYEGRFTAWALRDKTHMEKPWNYTYNKLGSNSRISEDIIREFFSSRFNDELPQEEEEAMFSEAGAAPNKIEWLRINEYVGSL
ncbi:hypothetical protein AGMMS50276_20890 [Synergistales bacterium]|nr:hypothetical protein AGMMS50276_20890 [Synergistales bacterium]